MRHVHPDGKARNRLLDGRNRYPLLRQLYLCFPFALKSLYRVLLAALFRIVRFYLQLILRKVHDALEKQ